LGRSSITFVKNAIAVDRKGRREEGGRERTIHACFASLAGHLFHFQTCKKSTAAQIITPCAHTAAPANSFHFGTDSCAAFGFVRKVEVQLLK